MQNSTIAKRDSASASRRRKNAKAVSAHGFTLMLEGKYDEAIFAFKRATDADADYAIAHVYMGHVFAKLGNYSRAIACYEKSLHVDADYARGHLALAQAQLAAADPMSAVESLTQALRLDPDLVEATELLARLYHQLGQTDDAVELLEDCVDIYPEHIDAWKILVDIHLDEQAWPHAEACLRAALAFAPADEELRTSMRELLTRFDRYQEAAVYAR